MMISKVMICHSHIVEGDLREVKQMNQPERFSPLTTRWQQRHNINLQTSLSQFTNDKKNKKQSVTKFSQNCFSKRTVRKFRFCFRFWLFFSS